MGECIDLTDVEEETAKANIMRMAQMANAQNSLLQAHLQRQGLSHLAKRGRNQAGPGPPSCRSHGGEQIDLVSSSDEDVDMVQDDSDMQVQRPFKRMRLHSGAAPGTGSETGMAAAAVAGQGTGNGEIEQRSDTVAAIASGPIDLPENNLMLRDLAMLRRMRMQQNEAGGSSQASARPTPGRHPTSNPTTVASDSSSSEPPIVSILTYNVWFNEEVALEDRMQGLASVIEETGFPDFLLLQVDRVLCGGSVPRHSNNFEQSSNKVDKPP